MSLLKNDQMNQREGVFAKKSVPPRGTPTKPAKFSASFIAYPTPRGMINSRCKQVSRLCLILPAHLPAFAVASLRAFVRFTVTGTARNSHPCSYDAAFRPRRASLRRYTGYSFVRNIILSIKMHVNSFLLPALVLFFFSLYNARNTADLPEKRRRAEKKKHGG